ncbi:hypothetical protein F4703DRAFT_1933663 [Phycomyces blakesleeanus]
MPSVHSTVATERSFMSSSCTSVQFRFAFKHKYFLNPTQLSASVQCPVPSCFLAQVLFKPSAAVY